MNLLYRFWHTADNQTAQSFSFALSAGDIRLWQMPSIAEKMQVLEAAIGQAQYAGGRFEIQQGERRRVAIKRSVQAERRQLNCPPPSVWMPVQEARLGRVGWVAGNGGLISNLKVWENVTLPLWFHAPYETVETEQRLRFWLTSLGQKPASFAELMAAPPANLALWQKKLVGLLRALVQMPRVLIIDAEVFEAVSAELAQHWIKSLDTFAQQARVVLVLTDKATLLPWRKIEGDERDAISR